MFASDFEAFSRTLIHTILSTNNIHLWINSRQYFAEDSELIQLLHTWSLSVEELFILFGQQYFIAIQIEVDQNKRVMILLLLALGLLYSIHLTDTDPNTVYFTQGIF
jgi:peptidoglycan/LPS O-acetylase OafA/YrhL